MICGKEFIPTNSNQKYCLECKETAYKEGNIKAVKRWYKEHPEQAKETARKRYYKNRKKIIKQAKKWRKKNRKRYLESLKKSMSKRYRELGYEPVNKPFEGSEGHHMSDGVTVIYIPKQLHRSLYHNHKTGQGMDKIDSMAVRWFLMDLLAKRKEKIQSENY